MKTICLLESVSRTDGGIFEAESSLQKHLATDQGVEIDVVGLEDRFSLADSARWLPLKPRLLSPAGPRFLGYSGKLMQVLDPQADLLYAATLWRYPSWAALRWAERTGRPMIVAPHGSLDAWALANAAWKKKIASLFFKDRQLARAACLRALSTSEVASFRNYGLKNPIAVIPNGIEMPTDPPARVQKGFRVLLFLGRIHPKKGLANAIRAFAAAIKSKEGTPDGNRWKFVIAGWDQGGHENELRLLCEELGLATRSRSMIDGERNPLRLNADEKIVFWGPSFGREKEDLLNAADALILPSFSEGLPMSVLEGWSHGLPVVMTPECNLPEGFDADAAIRIETNPEQMKLGLETLLSMGSGDLSAMGERGRRLVAERFTWESVAKRMRQVYEWVLGGGVKPFCMLESSFPRG
jgi:poly(glycerol-phosphate) alpha-glucosyltransferase